MALTVFAGQSGSDIELWGTDGTTGRTFRIKDINPTGSANVGNTRPYGGNLAFAVVGNFAYFQADDGTTGQELWRTDGTLGGTTKVTEFFTNNGTAGDTSDDIKGYSPTNIIAAGGFLFFIGQGPATSNPSTSPPRYGIWKYDPGTGATSFISADNPVEMIAAGSRIYWTFDGGSGSGLSTSDGVAAAQNLVATGSFNAPPSALYAVGSTVYIGFGGLSGNIKKVVGTTVTELTGDPLSQSGFMHTSTHVYIISPTNELFVTTTGTTTVAEITVAGLSFDFSPAGPGGHTPGFAALGDKLIFSNNKTNAGVGANTGSEVWITGGATNGSDTALLKDIVPGLGNSFPHNFITVGSFVFFQATNGNGSVELWKTDGTPAGTVLVDTLFAGGMEPTGGLKVPGNFENMTVQNGVLLFSFDDGVHGAELWRSDGTAAGTIMVKELNTATVDQGYAPNVSGNSASLGATGVFVGWNQQSGYELYFTNGTPNGTALLKDINPGGGHSMPSQFAVAGTNAFFTAYSPTSGNELWVTNGTPGGTVLVRDIKAGFGGSDPGGMTNVGSNTVFFSANNGINGQELWASDGTSAGTGMILDINPGSSGGAPRDSYPSNFVVAGGNVFFLANTLANGRELWVTNGSAAGTHITKDILAGAGDSGVSNGGIIAYNNKVFFQAYESSAVTSKGIELWVSDGTSGNTVMLKDLNTEANGSGGTNSSYPSDFVLANNLFFFRAQTTSISYDVYRSDGTNPGTTPVTSGLSGVGTLVAAGNKVFFSAQGPSGQELYVTSGGAATLIDIFPGPTGSNPQYLTVFGDKVLFQAMNTANNGVELWISDGTVAQMVKNISAGASASSNPTNFVVVGSKAYFIANDGTNGPELWVTDGVVGGPGTFMVKNIGPGGTSGSVNPFKAIDNNHLLFGASDGPAGQELWITDGTLAGTFKATDVLQPQSGFSGSFQPIINGGNYLAGTFATVPHTLPAGATGEIFNGTAEGEYFEGLGGIDTLNGFGGNDTLRGGAANDALNGGRGFDTAVFGGTSGSYSWSVTGRTTQITGTDGTDTLVGVEQMQFNNAIYQYQFTGFAPLALFTNSFGASPAAGGWVDYRNYPRMAADINGDGNADLLGFGSGGVYAALTTAGGGPGPTYLALNSFGAAPAAGSWVDDRTYPRTLGDINGDGRADLVGFGSGGVYASLATGGGFFGGVYLAIAAFGAAPAAGSWVDNRAFPRMLADINGDGLDDLVGFGGAGVYAALATGGGNFGALYLAAASFGTDAAAGGWVNNDLYPRTLADINGDGRADIIGFGDAGVYAAYANANGTFGPTFLAYQGFGASAAAGGWSSNDLYYRTVGDIDGDGDTDLVGFASAGVFVAEGDGAGAFGPGQLLMAAFGASPGAGGWASQNSFPRTLADIDGDGTDDIIGFGNAGAFTTLSMSEWLLV